MVWGRILGRFEDLGRGFSTTRPLRFGVPRRLGFWGCEQEIAATKTRKTIFCPCSLQRPQQQNVDLLVFVAALSLWLSFPGSLDTARRNARSDPPPHRRWRRVLNPKSKSWPNIFKPKLLSFKGLGLDLRITPSLSLPRATHIPPGRPQDVLQNWSSPFFLDFFAFQNALQK